MPQIKCAAKLIATLRTLETGQFFSTSHTEYLAFLFERDRGLGGELSRGEARGPEPERERHGAAPGMCRRDQLFRVGALLVFESGPERIGGLCKHAGTGCASMIRANSSFIMASRHAGCFNTAITVRFSGPFRLAAPRRPSPSNWMAHCQSAR
jgi:hypothetical protein